MLARLGFSGGLCPVQTARPSSTHLCVGAAPTLACSQPWIQTLHACPYRSSRSPAVSWFLLSQELSELESVPPPSASQKAYVPPVHVTGLVLGPGRRQGLTQVGPGVFVGKQPPVQQDGQPTAVP